MAAILPNFRSFASIGVCFYITKLKKVHNGGLERGI